MSRKIIGILICVLFVGASVVPNISGNIREENTIPKTRDIIYVPDDYPTIQGAIDVADSGDTIIVRDGNYSENIVVNKEVYIKSENGSDLTIVQAATSSEDVFKVTENYVNITGFTIKGATEWGYHSIYLFNADWCVISNNSIISNFHGIHLFMDSDNNEIRDNYVANNLGYGISMEFCDNNSIIGNKVMSNAQDAGFAGIYIRSYSSNNTVIDNEVTNHSSNDRGIWLRDNSVNNTVIKNKIKHNYIGLDLMENSNDNTFYFNDFIDNDINVNSIDSSNIWNSTQPFNYKYHGNNYINYLGNHWDDYTGEDNDGDGIGEASYIINGGQDIYPLMEPFENYLGIDSQPPYAPSIIGPNSGKPGEELTFIFNAVDPDGDDVRFIIDWGDTNNDTTTFVPSGIDKSASHIWSTEDTFTITVFAEDVFGNIGPSTTKQITIPRDKTFNNLLLNWLQSHPNLFPLMQKLIQQLGFGL
jgi:parallel beta-helix repeat protein